MCCVRSERADRGFDSVTPTIIDIYNSVCLGHRYAKGMAAGARSLNYSMSSKKEAVGGLRLPGFGESAKVKCGNGHGGCNIQ